VIQQQQNANDLASRANIFFIAGGAAAGVGAALLTLVLLEPDFLKDAQPSVVVTDDGVQVMLRVRW